ncbi:glycosyltransferase family 9 protein [Caenimonas aquaedulcis]|uniref:Glycosyltransferase n=1 Tax=Caenimonas aquaedulcis TaxID=2793270 RepID=A0A931H472_9BURK|nr:glycosyltransferase family 9 protein [Caenimonas aquaedulcis]MBG9388178.1 glycosyltransferase [Caenimonas aquaedulcis]
MSLDEVAPDSGQQRADRSQATLPLRVVIDAARFDQDGALNCLGWAVGSPEIIALTVMSRGQEIGRAKYGLKRPDVGERMARYPGAAVSGFSFVGSSPLLSDLRFITLQVLQRDGKQTNVLVPLAMQADSPVHVSRTASVARAVPDTPPQRPAAALRMHCDKVTIRADGSVGASGWALHKSGISSIEIFVGDAKVGEATAVLPRPDVADEYPEAAQGPNCGFEFRGAVGRPLEGPQHVSVRVRSNSGEEVTARRTVEVEATARPAAVAGASAIRLHLDAPESADGVVRGKVDDRLTVIGWAVGQAAIASVTVYFDDERLGDAYHGIRRQDIEQAVPDWPNALLSGFAFAVPARVLRNGDHRLKVVATDAEGRTQAVEVSVAVDRQSGNARQPLRTRIPFVETQTLRNLLESWRQSPRFLAIVPVREFGEAGESLAATLKSICAQTYADWQVIVLHDLRGAQATSLKKRSLEAMGEVAARLSVRSLGETGWPEAARGASDLVAVLRPGDVWASDAFIRFALRFASGDRGPAVIYADERRQDELSGEWQAFHKPGWSPQLAWSTNYLGRGWVATSPLAQEEFQTPGAYACASDYERVLRMTERAKAVIHLPQLLTQLGGTADTPQAERAALQSAMRRRGEGAKVLQGLVRGSYRIKPAAAVVGKVSIIIPTIAARGLVETCVRSIRERSTYTDFEIILVDNIRGPSAKWKRWFKANANRVVHVDEDFNWSRLNNLGRKQASGDYLLFLNDDIEVIEPGWLEALLEQACNPQVGVVGARLLYPDGKVQHAGMFLSNHGVARHAFRFAEADDAGYFGQSLTLRNVAAVTGACMMVKAEVFDRLGGFDEAHSVINNDIDFCLRAQAAGLNVVYTPFAQLRHHELASRAQVADVYDRSAFLKQWAAAFDHGDPYFNPNLLADADDFLIDTEPLRTIFAGSPLFDAAAIRRILVVKLDHIGDFITSIPAIRKLHAAFPEASLTLLVAPAVAQLARSLEGVSEVIEFSFFHARSGSGMVPLTPEALDALRARLVARQFDLAADLRKHPDTRHLLQCTGAVWLAGFDHRGEFPWLDIALEWEGDLATRNKHSHVSEDLVNLVSAITNAGEVDRSLMPREASLGPLPANVPEEIYRRPVVCIHPAAGSPMRQWPAAHFSRLVDLLVRALPVNVVLVGGPDEVDLAGEVLAGVTDRKRVWSLVGKTKLSEMPAVLQRCALFIGNNSGPQHLAAALGVPTVAIHSAVIDSREWGPIGTRAIALRRDMHCGPCYLATPGDCFRGLACLTQITPRSVFERCREFLRIPQ